MPLEGLYRNIVKSLAEMAVKGNDKSLFDILTARAALDGVATATAKLATDGNANARVVIDELRKRGVTIRPNATP